MEKLSNKLSEAARQAMHDLELCMNDDRYVINFNTWHRPVNSNANYQFRQEVNDLCCICFAGTVMVKSLKADPSRYIDPSDFPEHENILRALDDLREGLIHSALGRMDIDAPDGISEEMKINQKDYSEFKKDMEKVITELEKFGL